MSTVMPQSGLMRAKTPAPWSDMEDGPESANHSLSWGMMLLRHLSLVSTRKTTSGFQVFSRSNKFCCLSCLLRPAMFNNQILGPEVLGREAKAPLINVSCFWAWKQVPPCLPWPFCRLFFCTFHLNQRMRMKETPAKKRRRTY